MTHLVGEHNMCKMLLGNQATLHVFKNETLVSNIIPETIYSYILVIPVNFNEIRI